MLHLYFMYTFMYKGKLILIWKNRGMCYKLIVEPDSGEGMRRLWCREGVKWDFKSLSKDLSLEKK